MKTLVYDGDCAFCTSSVQTLARMGLQAAHTIPWQQADLAALGLTEQQCREKVQYVDAHGYVSGGHVAIAHLMQDGSRAWRLAGKLMMIPPNNWLAALVYRLVAANRMRLPGGTPACAVPREEQP